MALMLTCGRPGESSRASECQASMLMKATSCIFLELFTKRPVFQGQDEIDQLDVIYKYLGTPSPRTWPTLENLPWYELVKPKKELPSSFRAVFGP